MRQEDPPKGYRAGRLRLFGRPGTSRHQLGPQAEDAGWGCSAAFPRTQRQQLPPLRDWRNESGRWRNWFGKQLVTGDRPTPVPERDSGRLGAGWRYSPGRGMKGIAPFPKPGAHTTGLAPKMPQVPPYHISGSSQVPQTWLVVAFLQL